MVFKFVAVLLITLFWVLIFNIIGIGIMLTIGIEPFGAASFFVTLALAVCTAFAVWSSTESFR